MKRILCVALFVAASIPAATAEANHDWDGVHWAKGRRAEVKVEFVDSLSSSWEPFLNKASATWAKSDVVAREIEGGKESSACGYIDRKVRVCDVGSLGSGVLGITNLSISGGHILAARVRLAAPTIGNDPDARRAVMCHELGHSLGLDHQFSGRSCLRTNVNKDSGDYNLPDAHDYAELEEIYDHNDRSRSADGEVTEVTYVHRR